MRLVLIGSQSEDEYNFSEGRGGSEISVCVYELRSYGVKVGKLEGMTTVGRKEGWKKGKEGKEQGGEMLKESQGLVGKMSRKEEREEGRKERCRKGRWH